MIYELLNFFHFAAEGPCVTVSGFLPSLYNRISCDSDTNAPVLHSIQDIFIIAANVTQILIAASGAIAIIIIIVASIYFVTSMGDPARIKRAKEILQNATIGLVLIIAAYGIVQFVAGKF